MLLNMERLFESIGRLRRGQEIGRAEFGVTRPSHKSVTRERFRPILERSDGVRLAAWLLSHQYGASRDILSSDTLGNGRALLVLPSLIPRRTSRAAGEEAKKAAPRRRRSCRSRPPSSLQPSALGWAAPAASNNGMSRPASAENGRDDGRFAGDHCQSQARGLARISPRLAPRTARIGPVAASKRLTPPIR